MTRLTLHWHLRGIAQGTTEPEQVRVTLDAYSEYRGRWQVKNRRYTDPSTDGFDEYQHRGDAASYTSGFCLNSGDFCDAFDVRAHEALRADDTVAYLDAVSKDPTVRFQRRIDASQLLNHHLFSPGRETVYRPCEPASDENACSSTITPIHTSVRCARCHEAECLADPDVLRKTGCAVCMTCGLEQTIPKDN